MPALSALALVLLAFATGPVTAARASAAGSADRGRQVHHGPHGELDVDVCSAPTAPRQVRCQAVRRIDAAATRSRPGGGGARPAGRGVSVAPTIGDGGAYSPAYLQSAYNAPSATGGVGETVAVVDPFDSSTIASDLSTYRSRYNLPSCTTANGCFRKTDQLGGTNYPPTDSTWALEIALDVDMVSALCPNCRILLVEADSPAVSDVGLAVNTAVSLGADVVSNSYGTSEYSSEMTDSASYYHHPGVAIVASSGDSGYGTVFPASSSDVLAVGGTTLNQATSTGTRNATETAWSRGGSGCSSYVSKPTWQQDPGCARRMSVDVSADADPNTGVWVYTGGNWGIYGGTSAAAPMVAAIYALAGNPITSGALPVSYPYVHHEFLNDIVSGSNGTCPTAYFCTAGTGYDGPTGLGTPNTAAAFKPPVAPGTTVVAAAGAVATQPLMTSLAAAGYGTTSTPFYNVPADFALAGAASYTVPGQDNASCPEDTQWTPDPLAPGASTAPTEGVSPYGSDAGRSYLAAEDNAANTGPNANGSNPPSTTATGTDSGCVAVARSSSGPRTSSTGDRIGFEYDAFAMDAVSWASTSLRAPPALTQSQLLAIYNCTVTNWAQVGGLSGSIRRYFPRVGSESRAFFITDVLGQPATYAPPSGVAGCPDPILIDEDEGRQVSPADTDAAIMPYSAAAWDVQQSNSLNPSLDRRVDSVGAIMVLRAITTASPAPGAPVTASPIRWNAVNHDYEPDTSAAVKESNVRVNLAGAATPAFPGIRYVYDVVDRNLTAGGIYTAAESLFGFDNSSSGATAKSPICSNLDSGANQVLALGAVESAGFAPLDRTSSFNGSNLSGATCRQFLVTT